MEVVDAFRVSNFDTFVSHLDKIDERFTWLASQLPFAVSNVVVAVSLIQWELFLQDM
jgi:uncharacterized membrane protein YqhA